MPRNSQHILLNLEITPPTGSWEQIASRLETEYDPQEIKIAQKLSAFEMPPPAETWTSIANTLQENSITEQPATVAPIRRLPFRRVAVAAAVMGIVGVIAWNFLRNDNNRAANVISKEVPPTENITVIKDPPPAVPAVTDSSNNLPRPYYEKPVNGRSVAAARTNVQPDYPTTDIAYSSMNNVPANVSPPVTVEGPPIKDASGNVVLDLKLLTTPGNNYVTVTGPNGEQTRISRKFLPMLTYLNAGIDNGEYNNLWKNRFREWRDKLMQQASFAPSATNFLDIMELKELLEEK